MLTNKELIYRKILENPEDKAPKLIYADYLEENGYENEELIEFIRLQVNNENVNRQRKLFLKNKDIFNIFKRRFNSSKLEAKDFSIKYYEEGIVRYYQEYVCIKYADGFLSEIKITEKSFMRHISKLINFPIRKIEIIISKIFPSYSVKNKSYIWSEYSVGNKEILNFLSGEKIKRCGIDFYYYKYKKDAKNDLNLAYIKYLNSKRKEKWNLELNNSCG